MKSRFNVLMLLFLLLTVCAISTYESSAAPPMSYSIKQIPVPNIAQLGCNKNYFYQFSGTHGLNDNSQYAGTFACMYPSSDPSAPWEIKTFAIIWDSVNGTRLIGDSSGLGSSSRGINNSGEVLVLDRGQGPIGRKGFVVYNWDGTNSFKYQVADDINCGVVPYNINKFGSIAYEIYNNGRCVENPAASGSSYIRMRDGSISLLPFRYVRDINDEGATIYARGERISAENNVEALPGYIISKINRLGDAIAGRTFYDQAGLSTGFESIIWSSDGSIVVPKRLQGSSDFILSDIGENGTVVGWSFNSANPNSAAATIWIKSEPYNLNALISEPTNANLVAPDSYSVSGAILVRGQYKTDRPVPYPGMVNEDPCTTPTCRIYDANRKMTRVYEFLLVPDLSMSTESLSYGSRTIFTSTSLRFTVKNNKSKPLSLGVPTIAGTDRSQFKIGRSCGKSLSAGATCSVVVYFSPASAGNKVASISMNVGITSQTVSLQGVGVQ